MKRFSCIFLLLFNAAFAAQQRIPTKTMLERQMEWKFSTRGVSEKTLKHYVELARKKTQQLASQFGISSEIKEIDMESVEKLLSLLKKGQPKVFISIDIPAEKGQWLESFQLSLIWALLQTVTNNCFCVQSAEDFSAQKIGELFADAGDTRDQPIPIWNLQPGKFTESDYEQELRRPLCTQTVFIALTYNHVFQVFSKLLGVEMPSLSSLGMLVVTSDEVAWFPHGLFKEDLFQESEKSKTPASELKEEDRINMS